MHRFVLALSIIITRFGQQVATWAKLNSGMIKMFEAEVRSPTALITN
jgi:hypothetical protein